MPRIRILRLLALAALVAACQALNPVDTCACSLAPPFDIVYGTVTEPGGAVVAGAAVHAHVGAPDCQSPVDSRSEQTDAAGRYRVPVTRTGGYTEQCIRLVALAPPGSGWRDSDTTRFTMPTPQSHPPDSVRYDLALRAP
jgi:hypothetical protein